MSEAGSTDEIAVAHPKRHKHIVYLTNEVPNKEYDTVLYTGFLMIRGLRDAGFDVTVALLELVDGSVAPPDVRQRWLDDLHELGVDVVSQSLSAFPEPPKRGLTRIARPLRKLLLPQIRDHFPLISNAPKVTELVQSLNPDLVIYWGNFQTIPACAGLKHLPFVAILGEPPHFPEWFRIRPPFRAWSYRLTYPFWRQSLILRINRRLSLRLLRKFHSVWCTVTYLTNWYRDNGIANCQHVRNVVPDWGGADWQSRRAAAPKGDKLKIVLMGNVGGTSTVAGIYFLVDDILPHLERLLDGQFEIHICGSGKLPDDLKWRLQRPGVVLRGFVDDIISELTTSDVFLVPTPIPLGSRVRVAYAWSVGCCVISHTANCVGLEEMEGGDNALLGSSGLEVAQAILRSREEPALTEQIQANGRKTFERYYSESATVDKIVSKVEELVGSSEAAAPCKSRHV